jgi:hypothetical protein
VLEGLSEPETRVENKAIVGNPGCTADRHPFAEEGSNLSYDVVVSRCLLHRQRLTRHMHETHRAVAGGHRLERPGKA